MGQPLAFPRHTVPQAKTVAAHRKDFHLAVLKVGNVKPVLPWQSKGHVGGELALGGNTVDDFTLCPQDGDISLAKHGEVQQSVLIERHAVRSFPPRRRISTDHISKERARSMQLTIPPSITVYVAGNRFIQIKHGVR